MQEQIKKSTIVEVLSKEEKQPSLKKITDLINALLNQKEFTCATQFKELGNHVITQHNLLKNYKPSKATPIQLRVLQWDKTHPETFFLGDYVSCCLATNGTKFPTIVQRRMDEAMLFHVALDLETKKPIALIWLYLAEKEDGSITLIANFFEVQIKYALDENTRKAVLTSLLLFTEEYLADNPNITGLYLNPVNYSESNDFTSYPYTLSMIKNKLGGPLLLETSANSDYILQTDAQSVRNTTKAHYDLTSLSFEYLPTFDAKVLKKEVAAVRLKIVNKTATALATWGTFATNSEKAEASSDHTEEITVTSRRTAM